MNALSQAHMENENSSSMAPHHLIHPIFDFWRWGVRQAHAFGVLNHELRGAVKQIIHLQFDSNSAATCFAPVVAAPGYPAHVAFPSQHLEAHCQLPVVDGSTLCSAPSAFATWLSLNPQAMPCSSLWQSRRSARQFKWWQCKSLNRMFWNGEGFDAANRWKKLTPARQHDATVT